MPTVRFYITGHRGCSHRSSATPFIMGPIAYKVFVHYGPGLWRNLVVGGLHTALCASPQYGPRSLRFFSFIRAATSAQVMQHRGFVKADSTCSPRGPPPAMPTAPDDEVSDIPRGGEGDEGSPSTTLVPVEGHVWRCASCRRTGIRLRFCEQCVLLYRREWEPADQRSHVEPDSWACPATRQVLPLKDLSQCGSCHRWMKRVALTSCNPQHCKYRFCEPCLAVHAKFRDRGLAFKDWVPEAVHNPDRQQLGARGKRRAPDIQGATGERVPVLDWRAFRNHGPVPHGLPEKDEWIRLHGTTTPAVRLLPAGACAKWQSVPPPPGLREAQRGARVEHPAGHATGHLVGTPPAEGGRGARPELGHAERRDSRRARRRSDSPPSRDRRRRVERRSPSGKQRRRRSRDAHGADSDRTEDAGGRGAAATSRLRAGEGLRVLLGRRPSPVRRITMQGPPPPKGGWAPHPPSGATSGSRLDSAARSRGRGTLLADGAGLVSVDEDARWTTEPGKGGGVDDVWIGFAVKGAPLVCEDDRDFGDDTDRLLTARMFHVIPAPRALAGISRRGRLEPWEQSHRMTICGRESFAEAAGSS